MSWFAQNLFTKWFTQYHKTEDSYKDLQGRGLLERYVQTIGQEIDTNILPYLENLQNNILQPKSIFAKLLPFREQELGVNLVYDDTVERRKQILQYCLRLVQIKGTKRGYEVCIRLMNFNGLIIDTVDVITYFDNPLPSAGCNACYEYDVIVKGNKEIIDLTIVDAFFNLIDWNEPINCKLRFFIYNDTFVPRKLVQFLFKGFDDENLYIDIKRNPEFKAKLDTLLYNQGDLLLEDEFAEFYQYDSEYWYNQGYMLFNKPTPDAYLPFISLVTSNVTQTTATVNWESEPSALFYVLNVGLDLKDEGNEIVTSKIIDNLNVGLVLSYDLTGLTPNTPYYTQIKAVRADSKQALSHPQAFITMRNVPTPIALPASEVTANNFRTNWIIINGVNGYELQVSTDIDFVNIVASITINTNTNNATVTLPNTTTYFYRVRAIINKVRNLPVVVSYSNWSNVIIVNDNILPVIIPFEDQISVVYNLASPYKPLGIVVYDSEGNVVQANISVIGNTLTVTFGQITSGFLAFILTENFMEFNINNLSVFTTTHNLGRLPIGLMVYDNLGNAVMCALQANNSTLTVEFSQPFTGKVLFI